MASYGARNGPGYCVDGWRTLRRACELIVKPQFLGPGEYAKRTSDDQHRSWLGHARRGVSTVMRD